MSTNAIIYKTEKTCNVDLTAFEALRTSQMFFDLKILTLEKEEIEVHRFALATRFPHVRRTLPKSANCLVEWSRFPSVIIRAALDYAYTGQVAVNEETALQLFLFAVNLGCTDIQDCCLDFLDSRISEANLADAWSVANATKDEALIDLCLPTMRDHLEAFIETPRFSESTDPLGMARILSEPTLESSEGADERDSAPKNRLLTKWLEGLSSDVAEQRQREYLESLLHDLDLYALTFNTLSLLLEASAVYKLANDSRSEIRFALKFSKDNEPAIRGFFSEALYMLERTDVNREYVVKEFSQLDKYPKSEFKVQMGAGSSVVMNRDYLCIVGDADSASNSSSVFNLMDLNTKTIFPGPDLPEPLCHIYAFGFNGDIACFGNVSSNMRPKSKLLMFSLTESRWSYCIEPPFSLKCEAAYRQSGVGVLFCATQAAYLFYPPPEAEKWEWKELPKMRSSRENPGITYFRDHFFVAGGNTGRQFDVETLQWPLETGEEPQWTVISCLAVTKQSPFNLTLYGDKLFLIYGDGEMLEYDSSKEGKKDKSLSALWKRGRSLRNVKAPILIPKC